MNKERNKALPLVLSNSDSDKIVLNNISEFDIKFDLNLFDKKGKKIINFEDVDNDTRAIITINVTRRENTEKFADQDDSVAYHFADTEGLTINSNKIEISEDKKDEFLKRINKIHSDFMRTNCKVLGIKRKDGLEKTADMEYSIEENYSGSNEKVTIRVDVHSEEAKFGKKLIIGDGDKIEIKFIWNKRIQTDPITECLITYSNQKSSENKSFMSRWGVFLIIFLLASVGLIIVFHRQIINWFKGRRKKSDQLEIF